MLVCAHLIYSQVSFEWNRGHKTLHFVHLFSVNVASMLACVKFGNGIRVVYNSPTAFFNNIGAVKCYVEAPNGMSIVDEALVDCWLDQGPCTPDMYDVDLNTDLGKCIAYAWVTRYEGNADYSMMIVV